MTEQFDPASIATGTDETFQTRAPAPPSTKAEEILGIIKRTAPGGAMAPGAPGGGLPGLVSDQDMASGAAMELFQVPDNFTDVEQLKDLIVKSDLSEKSIMAATRVLALSQQFDDIDDPDFVSFPRQVLGWFFLLRIAKDRQGRNEYSMVLGHQMRAEASDMGF